MLEPFGELMIQTGILLLYHSPSRENFRFKILLYSRHKPSPAVGCTCSCVSVFQLASSPAAMPPGTEVSHDTEQEKSSHLAKEKLDHK